TETNLPKALKILIPISIVLFIFLISLINEDQKNKTKILANTQNEIYLGNHQKTETIQQSTYKTIERSYDQVMSHLSNSFKMEKIISNKGQEKYVGKTDNLSATIELFGDKQNLSEAILYGSCWIPGS
ncbi:MAG: hypothetical protein JRI28_03175, partial [Deltaproteobacteria bacterium]|nr:hypothetical protein [Deltaproteobacteria bacterium]